VPARAGRGAGSAFVRLADVITEQRDRNVHAHVRPLLDAGEEVVHWVRAQDPDRRRQGYAFITNRRLLVVWSGSGDGHREVAWSDVHAWGVDTDADNGPVLAVECPAVDVVVCMPVASRSTARRVTGFVRKLSDLAPSPRRSVGYSGGFRTDPAIEVTLHRLSARALTQRALATLIGLALFFGGVAIIPIPGPWSLPLILAGLAVLASEYDWAKDVLEWTKARTRAAKEKLRARRAAR
jgi:hypothetical protein